ncbi:unnamed protein product [Vitrella brassicaformis CCMP3155]|uniref:Uncharacterized protein n=1 Tax=Vitrella brassicaformis (strain CCMP3155) TaxID=1169540 RepID=A0A0G4GJ91_VITBC|nr:unnamed protein product [Vitrella brassicaformis CCMP3155]|eukprot:CEM29897.1 unnamed protein product [Vitrella brassicaformis CCMP3155]
MPDADACWLVGLPEDVERRLLTSLTAYDCVALRASSKSVGCQLVSEVNLTRRLDAAIREKGLGGVLTYQKRCETVLLILLQWMAAIFSVVSTLVQVTVGLSVLLFIYTSIRSWAVVLTSFLVQQPAVFLDGSVSLLSLLVWVVLFEVIEVAIRWLGEESIVVRAYRQFWVALNDLGHFLGVWILLECARSIAFLTPPLGVEIMAWLLRVSSSVWLFVMCLALSIILVFVTRSVKRRVALSIGKLFLECVVALLSISGICVAWLWSPSDECSVQLVTVAMRWHLCILPPVCLGIMCLRIWRGLMDVQLLIDTRASYLLRVLYVIEEGGCWDRCVSLIYYLKNSRRLPSLPIIITAHDLRRAGSRAVFISRPEAVRQYGLFSHRVRRPLAQIDYFNGQDYLGGLADTDALKYVSIDLTESDPPTRRDGYVYSSITDLIILVYPIDESTHSPLRPHVTYPSDLLTPPPKQYQLTPDVIRHARGQWNGCRKAGVWWVDKGTLWQVPNFILCGDKAADAFLVHVDSRLGICTTEPPVAWKRRPDERYPRTAALIRQKVVAA